jgi:hypothetical protein
MEDDHNISEMEDNLNFFEKGRRSHKNDATKNNLK